MQFRRCDTLNLRNSGYFLVVVVVAGVVVAGHFLPGLDRTAVDTGIRNALHVITFGLSAAIMLILMRRSAMPGAALLTLGIVVAIGVLSEYLQSKTGKQFDPSDLARDVAGGILGVSSVLFLASAVKCKGRVSVYSRRMIGIALAAGLFVPLAFWASVIWQARAQFPTVISFDKEWESHLYFTVNADLEMITTAPADLVVPARAAELTLTRMGRSGLGVNVMAHNWSGYEFLAFDAAMIRGSRTSISLRLNDNKRFGLLGDEFIWRSWVEERPSTIRVPLKEISMEAGKENLDISDIRQFFLFARDKRARNILRVDNFRLE